MYTPGMYGYMLIGMGMCGCQKIDVGVIWEVKVNQECEEMDEFKLWWSDRGGKIVGG